MNLKKFFGLMLIGLILILFSVSAQEKNQAEIKITFAPYQVEIYVNCDNSDNESYDPFPYFIVILAKDLKFNPETGQLNCKRGGLMCIPVEEDKPKIYRSLDFQKIDIIVEWPFININEVNNEGKVKKAVTYQRSEAGNYLIVKTTVPALKKKF